jgi:hypothetical protein
LRYYSIITESEKRDTEIGELKPRSRQLVGRLMPGDT